jgi:hypothetical protein
MKRRSTVQPRIPMRPPRSRHIAIYVIGVGVWLSGSLWLLFHYFVVHPGPFGPASSPLEPWWLKLHGAFAFAAIWIFGLLWGVHIPAGWSGGRRRGTGGLLVTILGWLVLSGYLLYYLGDETARPLISLLHLDHRLGHSRALHRPPNFRAVAGSAGVAASTAGMADITRSPATTL